MGLKQTIGRMMPSLLRTTILIRKETKALGSLPRLQCDTDSLRCKSALSLHDVFNSSDIHRMWGHSQKATDTFSIPDGTGGVNPGDRRALYYLISALKPASVLEIGTHIGASTLHIASALYMSQIQDGKSAGLTTVDIKDVNDPVTKPWLRYGATASPSGMLNKLDYGGFVTFVVDGFLRYAASCEQRFDLVFLDGDHAAKAVYQDIPAALRLLNPHGIVLLHDYFPGMKPLWSNGSVIPGPFLATERLAQEGAKLMVLPLGSLPWTTKLQSNVTSLALLLRNE